MQFLSISFVKITSKVQMIFSPKLLRILEARNARDRTVFCSQFIRPSVWVDRGWREAGIAVSCPLDPMRGQCPAQRTPRGAGTQEYQPHRNKSIKSCADKTLGPSHFIPYYLVLAITPLPGVPKSKLLTGMGCEGATQGTPLHSHPTVFKGIQQ